MPRNRKDLDFGVGRLSPTVPTTLRQVAQSIDPESSAMARGDAGYLNDAADAIERGDIDDMTLEDAIAIAKEYQ